MDASLDTATTGAENGDPVANQATIATSFDASLDCRRAADSLWCHALNLNSGWLLERLGTVFNAAQRPEQCEWTREVVQRLNWGLERLAPRKTRHD